MISELDYSLTPDLADRFECDQCDQCESMEAGPAWRNDGTEEQADWKAVTLCLPCIEQAREDGEEVSSEIEK